MTKSCDSKSNKKDCKKGSKCEQNSKEMSSKETMQSTKSYSK